MDNLSPQNRNTLCQTNAEVNFIRCNGVTPGLTSANSVKLQRKKTL